MDYFAKSVLVLILCFIFIGFLVQHNEPKNHVHHTESSFFYCYVVTNAQARTIKIEAQGPIYVGANSIKYTQGEQEYLLTNATCKFGLALKNVILEN